MSHLFYSAIQNAFWIFIQQLMKVKVFKYFEHLSFPRKWGSFC